MLLEESIFLTFTALGLIVLAGFDNYGLYVAIGVFWIIAAFNKYLGLLALWSIIIFMSGFAVMRLVNIAMNGMPSSFYLGMFISEVVIILIGIRLLK